MLRWLLLAPLLFAQVDLAAEPETFAVHAGRVNALVFSPGGETVASGADDTLIALSPGVDVFSGEGLQVRALAYSDDGAFLASSDFQGRIVIRDLASVEQAHRTIFHQAAVTGLAFAEDRFVYGAGDGTVRIYDAAAETLQRVIVLPAPPVNDLAFDGETVAVAVGFPADVVAVYDVDTGNERYTLDAHGSEVTGVELVGAVLYSAGFDARVRAWDAATGEPLFDFGTVSPVIDLAASATQIAVINFDGELRVHDIDGAPWALFRPEALATSVAVTDDALAIGTDDGTVMLWR